MKEKEPKAGALSIPGRGQQVPVLRELVGQRLRS